MSAVSRVLIASLSVALLAACSDRMAQAEQEMQAIRSAKTAPIEPLPEPDLVEDFVYSANEVRSPFLAPSLVARQSQTEQNDSVRPDIHRTKEPLENYELSELVYLGQVVVDVKKPSEQKHGLIRLPDGSVRDVTVGNYLGANDGKIIDILPTRIDLEEIIADPRGGFVKRTTRLTSPE